MNRCAVCHGSIPTAGSVANPRKYCGADCINAARRLAYSIHPRPRKPRPTFAERLWSRVTKMPNGCWEWQGYRMSYGYGQIGVDGGHGRTMTTHRAAWLLTHSDPGDLHVLHRCDNPPCVNPDHLFLGTNADNAADRDRKGRQARRFMLPHTKLTEDDVRAIRAAYQVGPAPGAPRKSNAQELALKYGLHPQYVADIAHGRERSDVA